MPRLHCINKVIQPIVLAQYALRKLNRAVVSRCFIVIVDSIKYRLKLTINYKKPSDLSLTIKSTDSYR